MNATTLSIIKLLPQKPLLSPAEIAAAYGLATTEGIAPADVAAAYGLATTQPIIADIKVGKLAANMINGRYIISRDAARDYIVANEYSPDEGTLK